MKKAPATFVPAQRDRVPTANETAAILAKASPEFWLIYSALRQCGARPGELCRATIADVDRANGVITLKEHKTARKTGQPRRIPIGRKLGELLDRAIGNRTEGPVFLSPKGKSSGTQCTAYRGVNFPVWLVNWLCHFRTRPLGTKCLSMRLGQLRIITGNKTSTGLHVTLLARSRFASMAAICVSA